MESMDSMESMDPMESMDSIDSMDSMESMESSCKSKGCISLEDTKMRNELVSLRMYSLSLKYEWNQQEPSQAKYILVQAPMDLPLVVSDALGVV